MKATLTIDDDVAEILEKRSRDENKPFEQVANEALRRGTSASNDPARLKEIMEEMEVQEYLRSTRQ